MTINYAYSTHTGLVRKINEDNLWCDGIYLPKSHESVEDSSGQSEKLDAIFCVFDGLGGEKCGEIASYLAAANFDKHNNKDTIQGEKDLICACASMNQSICDYASEHHMGNMGSTAAIIRINLEGTTADICNIGDSRIYLMRNNTLQQLTVDHTLYHPFTGKRMLTQNLGIKAEQMAIEPHISTVPIKSDDIFIICSDGLTDCCSDKVVQELVDCASDCSEAVALLKEAALANGAPDNITIIVCQVS